MEKAISMFMTSLILLVLSWFCSKDIVVIDPSTAYYLLQSFRRASPLALKRF